MVLETIIMLWVTELDFLDKLFCPENWGNEPKIGFFEFKEKFGILFSLNLFYNENLSYLLCSSTILYLGKILFLRYKGQNGLSQSDSRIFKSTIFPKQINETVLFFACWYKFTKVKSWSKLFCLGMVKNGFGQSEL